MGNLTYKKKHRALGLCVDCSHKALDNLIYCDVHNTNNKIRAKKITKKRILDKYCTRCGNELHDEMDLGYAQCTSCRGRVSTSVLRTKFATLF